VICEASARLASLPLSQGDNASLTQDTAGMETLSHGAGGTKYVIQFIENEYGISNG
jgi:hypothetical protein